MKCPSCGKEIEDATLEVCPFCGVSLKEEKTEEPAAEKEAVIEEKKDEPVAEAEAVAESKEESAAEVKEEVKEEPAAPVKEEQEPVKEETEKVEEAPVKEEPAAKEEPVAVVIPAASGENQTVLIDEETKLAAGEPVVEEKPVVVKERKPLIKPETMEAFKKHYLGSWIYFFKSIVSPSVQKIPMSTPVSLFTVLHFLVFNTLTLFLFIKAVVKWIKGGLSGLSSSLIRIYPSTTNVSLSFWRVLLGGILITIGLLLVVTIMLMVSRALKKEQINFFICLKAAIHQTVLPVFLFLLSAVIMSFTPTWGLLCFFIVALIWLMNLVVLFKERYNWLSYLTVVCGVLVMVFILHNVLIFNLG